jgi:hypothetical protein
MEYCWKRKKAGLYYKEPRHRYLDKIEMKLRDGMWLVGVD